MLRQCVVGAFNLLMISHVLLTEINRSAKLLTIVIKQLSFFNVIYPRLNLLMVYLKNGSFNGMIQFSFFFFSHRFLLLRHQREQLVQRHRPARSPLPRAVIQCWSSVTHALNFRPPHPGPPPPPRWSPCADELNLCHPCARPIMPASRTLPPPRQTSAPRAGRRLHCSLNRETTLRWSPCSQINEPPCSPNQQTSSVAWGAELGSGGQI